MLGVNTVKNLALSTAAIEQLSGSAASGLDILEFWRHSLCVGVSSKLLAKKRGINPLMVEEYFIAGFLHDIGKIPINAVLLKDYTTTITIAEREKKPLYEAEKNTLGLDHCTAGAMVAASWKLTGAVEDTIMYHNECWEYKGDHKDILYTVVAANHLASNAGIGFSGNSHPVELPPFICETLDITRDHLTEIEEDVNSDIEKAEAFLKISLM